MGTGTSVAEIEAGAPVEEADVEATTSAPPRTPAPRAGRAPAPESRKPVPSQSPAVPCAHPAPPHIVLRC
ncbi:hypothetical protein [Streptomyces sp. NRRL F-5630]|uniref:hypothetical protein n=1 Tax=Streptomyces sp. NRRL F-5630 TaxID=1463864 RepID=UPI003D764582